MTISQMQIQSFMKFFTGAQHSYGECLYSGEKIKGKLTGACRTITDKLITIKDYKDHLEGVRGLGIVPISENSKCLFSVIDIDIYDADLSIYTEAIERGGLPLIPFRSKSGGLHIYMFLKEEENAKDVIEVMRKFSFLLSIDSFVRNKKNGLVEIFPKQTKLKKGDAGSWINLPYYGAVESSQYAIRNGSPLSFNDSLTYIAEKQTSLRQVEDLFENMVFNDAPPCLQLLYLLNPFDSNSNRNNFLFSFGVYLKKKDEDFFEQSLKEINDSIREPLEEKEVERTILSSLRKKDYVYKCKESPCKEFCNKKECRNREFGIGKNEGYFSSVEVGILYQYKTSSPYYEWEVRLQGQEEFKRLRFKTEDEIIRQDMFLRLCMRELFELPSKLKQSEWFDKVNSALKAIVPVVVEREDDTSPFMMIKSMITEFLTGRAMAETKDQIEAKRVFYDNTTDDYLFRTKDLLEYVYVQKQFKYFNPSELHGILKDLGCSSRKLTTESRKQLRVTTMGKKNLDLYEAKELFSPDFSKFSEEDF